MQWTVNCNKFGVVLGGKLRPLKEKEEDLARQNTKTCHSSSTRQSTMIVACDFLLFQMSVSTNQNVTSIGSIHHAVPIQSNCVCRLYNVVAHSEVCSYEAYRPNQRGLPNILLNKMGDLYCTMQAVKS